MDVFEFKKRIEDLENEVLDDLKNDSIGDVVYLLVLLDTRGREPDETNVFKCYKNVERHLKKVQKSDNEKWLEAAKSYKFWRLEKYIFSTKEYKKVLSCDFNYSGKFLRFIGDDPKYVKIDREMMKLEKKAANLYKTGDIVKLNRSPFRSDCFGIYGNGKIIHLDENGELGIEIFFLFKQLDKINDCDDEWLCQTSEKIRKNPSLFEKMSDEIFDKNFNY